MNLGEEKRELQVEPLQWPVPQEQKTPMPVEEPLEEEEPELVPVELEEEKE